MKKPPRKSLAWFLNRVGSDIIQNNQFNLFVGPIRVQSEQHAKALYAHQDKGHRYNL